MARLTIRLLGSFQAGLAETPITNFDSNKVRALLAYLVVESHQTHSREKLADLFWPELPAQRASSNLSQALYNLRQGIQDHQVQPAFLLRSRESVQFNPQSDYWLDVKAFNAQLDGTRVQTHSPAEQDETVLAEIQAAVDFYRGDFLAGLTFRSSPAFDEWVLIVRQRLQRRMLKGLYGLAEAYANRGEYSRALSYSWRQVDLDPLGEPAYRQLMFLLADSGQRSQALAQFKRLQILLAEELNISPEQETIALRDQIRGQERVPVMPTSQRDNLPAFLTPLIGRRAELAELQERLSQPDCRMLTILGPGGSGKTRLALEVARSKRETFREGVFFVPLNPLQSSASIVPAVAEALDLSGGDGDDHAVQLANYLREKDLLLVLDGFEHLLDGSGWVTEILHQAPGLKILVTTRTRLNLKGENLYLLDGMRYPQEGAPAAEIRESDAVQLLIAGLRRTYPAYDPSPAELNDLRQVCQQVLGMPLGILLAASWGGTLKVQEIAGMVSQSLDFLVANWSDLPARQRSLRATFDYSWNLLSERHQSIFQGLSVFRGPFTRRAARAVSEASPYELRDLMDRSLLWHKSPGWYEVHELLRQYGREKLAGQAAVEREVNDRHSVYYLGQLAHLGAAIKSAGQADAHENIDLSHENYRAAWNWAAEQGDTEKLSQTLEALCLYYDLSLRYPDGESACRRALDGLPVDLVDMGASLLRARILTWQGRFMRLLGQLDEAHQILYQAQVQLENVDDLGDFVRSAAAFLELEKGNNHFLNDRATAAACYQHSLQIYRQLPDDWGAAKALARLGLVAHHAGSFEDALQCYTESLEIYRSLGDLRGVSNALIEMGHNTFRQGQVSEGQEFIQEGTAILQQIGDQAGVARGYFELGRSYFWSGQLAKSVKLMSQSEPIFKDLGMRDRQVFTLIALSLGLSHLGRYQDAIAQVNKGLPIAREVDARREIAMAYLLLAKAYLGQKVYEQALESALESVTRYQEIDQKDELLWALSLTYFAGRGLNQPLVDYENIKQVLQIGIDIQGIYPVLCTICGIALCLLDQDEIHQAVELAALAWCYPVVANSQWFEDIAGREIAAAAGSLPADVVAAAQERGRKRDIWETAKELLAASWCKDE